MFILKYVHLSFLLLSLGNQYANLYTSDGNVTGSPQSMEKRRDRAKLVIAGAHEMCSTIMSKVFKCNGIAVLSFLLESLQCLHKLCYYYAIEFEDFEVKKKVECNSVYNPAHPQTVQMDCFRYVA